MARQVPLLHFALYSLIISAKSPCSAVKSSKSTKKIQLKFDEDGYFKIVQLADLHYGHFPETDQHTDKVGTWSNAQQNPSDVSLDLLQETNYPRVPGPFPRSHDLYTI